MRPKNYKAPSLAEIYDKLTAQLLERMQGGEIPWAQPWRAKGVARNLASKKPYRGFNQLVLNSLGGKYESPYWLTYNQAEELGGNVKRGEKSTPVIFWKILKPRGEAGEVGTEQEFEPESGEPANMPLTSKIAGRGIPLLRYYSVFNADQCENLKTNVELHPGRNLTPPTQTEAHEAAEGIMARAEMCPVKINGSDACYVPALDEIWMPLKSQFSEMDDFYHVAFHEMSHATGHKSRLGRLDRTPDATSDMKKGSYSKEELVAEMSAAYLASAAGLDMTRLTERSAAYLQHWLKRCKKEPELLINAAQLAQKATDWVLGLSPEQEKRRAEKESGAVLSAPGVENELPAVPSYEVCGRREFHAGDVVRYYQPGTENFATGILTGETERNYTIAGLLDLPRNQVLSLATKEQAKTKELYVANLGATDDSTAAEETATKWSHLNLTPTQDEATGEWGCKKIGGYPVQNVVAPTKDTRLFVDEDPAFAHLVEGDVYLGQLHSPDGRMDLYCANKGGKIEAVVRRSDDAADCIRSISPEGMAPVFAIAHDRARHVRNAQKERDLVAGVNSPSM